MLISGSEHQGGSYLGNMSRAPTVQFESQKQSLDKKKRNVHKKDNDNKENNSLQYYSVPCPDSSLQFQPWRPRDRGLEADLGKVVWANTEHLDIFLSFS